MEIPVYVRAVASELRETSAASVNPNPGEPEPRREPVTDHEVRILPEGLWTRINKGRNRRGRKYSAKKRQDLKP